MLEYIHWTSISHKTRYTRSFSSFPREGDQLNSFDDDSYISNCNTWTRLDEKAVVDYTGLILIEVYSHASMYTNR